MNIKLVASDIDGTLIDGEHKVSAVTKDVVNRLRARGVEFMIATGRDYESASGIAEQFGGSRDDMAIVSLNGMYVDYPAIGYHVEEGGMNLEQCRDMERIGNHYHMGVLYCYPDAIYYHMDETDHADYQLGISEESLRYFNEGLGLTRIASLDDILWRFEKGDKILKMVYIQNGDYVELVKERVAAEFDPEFNLLVVSSGWAEIMPRRINKGDALLKYAASRGILPEEIMTFGDSDNDLTLIERAGIGVAVKNARNSLKVLADDITDSNINHGVAQYIAKHILQEPL